jgi:hypothetical protein
MHQERAFLAPSQSNDDDITLINETTSLLNTHVSKSISLLTRHHRFRFNFHSIRWLLAAKCNKGH